VADTLSEFTNRVTHYVLRKVRQVVMQLLKRLGAIVHVSQCHVASPAQEAANLAGFMVVIYAQATGLTRAKWRLFSARGTLTPLRNEHFGIVIGCQSLFAKCHIVSVQFLICSIIFWMRAVMLFLRFRNGNLAAWCFPVVPHVCVSALSLKIFHIALSHNPDIDDSWIAIFIIPHIAENASITKGG